mmetsp:Transcript_38902/g.98506  ORF Transcript_38902/g.98506 Transcript_38902/m.98506 type:complete len:213 (+) Transcript_38902:883-1521(+)
MVSRKGSGILMHTLEGSIIVIHAAEGAPIGSHTMGGSIVVPNVVEGTFVQIDAGVHRVPRHYGLPEMGVHAQGVDGLGDVVLVALNRAVALQHVWSQAEIQVVDSQVRQIVGKVQQIVSRVVPSGRGAMPACQGIGGAVRLNAATAHGGHLGVVRPQSLFAPRHLWLAREVVAHALLHMAVAHVLPITIVRAQVILAVAPVVVGLPPRVEGR